METKIYYTKEVETIAFEIVDPVFESIDEQIDRVKKILIDRINEEFNVYKISAKEDFLIELSQDEKILKNIIVSNKTPWLLNGY